MSSCKIVLYALHLVVMRIDFSLWGHLCFYTDYCASSLWLWHAVPPFWLVSFYLHSVSLFLMSLWHSFTLLKRTLSRIQSLRFLRGVSLLKGVSLQPLPLDLRWEVAPCPSSLRWVGLKAWQLSLKRALHKSTPSKTHSFYTLKTGDEFRQKRNWFWGFYIQCFLFFSILWLPG